MWRVVCGCGVCCAVVLSSPSGAGAQQRRDRPIADTADRVARETWPVERDTRTEEGLTIFRTETAADAFRLPPPWLNDQRMGPRMPGTAAQRERLSIVTPEAFRGSVMYPAGVGIDPAAIVNGLKAPWRKWQEHRIRTRIQEEIAAITGEVSD